MKKLIFGLFLFIVFYCVQSSYAAYAVAWNKKTKTYSLIYNQHGLKQAEKEALRLCGKKCKIVFSGIDEGYGSVSYSKKGFIGAACCFMHEPLASMVAHDTCTEHKKENENRECEIDSEAWEETVGMR